MAQQVIDPATQYTEGDTDASVTGTAILWEDTGDTLRAVSAAKPLPVTGTVSVDTSALATLAEQQTQTTALQLIDNIVQTEDAAHVSGHQGIMDLGVVQYPGTMVNRSLTQDDYVPKACNVQGGQLVDINLENISSVYRPLSILKAEDSAHASGDAGVGVFGVRNETGTTFTSTEGDYSPISVGARGAVYVQIDSSYQSTTATGILKAEDAAHSSGATGVMMLGVRNDTAGATGMTDANGDYSPICVDDSGRLLTAYSVKEDAAHVSAQTGAFIVGVQNSNATTLANAEGDYTPFGVNQKGSLYVDIDIDNITGGQATSILKAEDSAHASGDAGVMSLAILKATPADTAGTDGDYQPLQMSAGRLWTSTTVTSSALPTGAATLAEQQTQSTSLTTIAGHVDGIEALLTTIDTSLNNIESAVATTPSLPTTPAMTRPPMGANTTTQILSSNSSRKKAIVMNNTANTIWIKEGSIGALSEGFPVFPSGQYNVMTTATVHGWNDGGAVTLDVLEAT